MRNGATGQVGNAKPREGRVRLFKQIGTGRMVRKDARAAEKPGEHDVAAGRIRCAGRQQIGRDNAKLRAQLKNIPVLATENGDGGVLVCEWIALARYGFYQGGLATAVRPEDADVFAGFNAQANVLQRRVLSPHHGDVIKVKERTLA